MIHPHTELKHIDDNKGHGVVATQLIPKGTIVWSLCALDHVFTHEELKKMAPIYYPYLHRYSWVTPEGTLVLNWDFERFINHSCDPNRLDIGTNLSIAVRDIEKGEELTCDYRINNILNKFECICNTSLYSNTILPRDDFNSAPFEKSIKEALALAPEVPQPLAPFIPFDDLTKLMNKTYQFHPYRDYGCDEKAFQEIKKMLCSP